MNFVFREHNARKFAALFCVQLWKERGEFRTFGAIKILSYKRFSKES